MPIVTDVFWTMPYQYTKFTSLVLAGLWDSIFNEGLLRNYWFRDSE